MQPFVTHRGRAAVLDWSDVNTDLIIPARYLKRIERTGYGPLFFADKRYQPGGAPDPDQPRNHGPLASDFPLNQPDAADCDILLVGRNFGCGSSREHAVWAVAQAGFRALIAPGIGEGFADIFENNALNNGLLVIELGPTAWSNLVALVRQGPKQTELDIDLRAQSVRVFVDGTPTETVYPFDIPPITRERLLQGLDAIGETLLLDATIRQYENQAPPWALVRSENRD